MGSYNISYKHSSTGNICSPVAVIPASACLDSGVCRHVFEVSSSYCHPSTDITVTVTATSMLESGEESDPITIGTVHYTELLCRIGCAYILLWYVNNSYCAWHSITNYMHHDYWISSNHSIIFTVHRITSSSNVPENLCIEVTSFSVAVAVEKQWRFFVDNLMLGVQLANVSTRCSSHPQGKRALRMNRASSRN